MDELGFDFAEAVAWFPHDQEQPYVIVRISPQTAAQLPAALAVALRRCYITDAALDLAAAQHNIPRSEVLQMFLPDPGAVMSGDFGEVIGYFYQAVRELPADAIGPKKWRLKQDRTQPAPKSDVVHFVMPNRPAASAADTVLCSEVKAKASAGGSTPIPEAIDGCKKDRLSRLTKTLVWLRERAMTTDLGDVDVGLLNRFIDAVDSPPATRRFRAVAVICDDLIENELASAPTEGDPEFTLVVIGVPNLRATYGAAFQAAVDSVT